jgi:hypothetical protein
MTESVLIAAVIEAKEERDIMTTDIPNAFVKTNIPISNERIKMKIKGALVALLIELNSTKFKKSLCMRKQKRYFMCRFSRRSMECYNHHYNKLKQDLIKQGFIINPYDPCVANRSVNDHQHTVVWHVNDLKSSHADPTVNDNFHCWLEKMYGDLTNHVKAVRGKLHDYLAMILDYTTP